MPILSDPILPFSSSKTMTCHRVSMSQASIISIRKIGPFIPLIPQSQLVPERIACPIIRRHQRARLHSTYKIALVGMKSLVSWTRRSVSLQAGGCMLRRRRRRIVWALSASVIAGINRVIVFTYGQVGGFATVPTFAHCDVWCSTARPVDWWGGGGGSVIGGW